MLKVAFWEKKNKQFSKPPYLAPICSTNPYFLIFGLLTHSLSPLIVNKVAELTWLKYGICFVHVTFSTVTWEEDKLEIFTFCIFMDLKIWRRSKPCQRRQKKNEIKSIHGNPPVHRVWRFSDPRVGPMENAKNQELELSFDYGQSVF